MSFVGLALPTFVLGLSLQSVLGIQLTNWFGIKPFYTSTMHTESFTAFLSSVTLPVLTLAFVGIAEQSRFAGPRCSRW